ncbi:MAG: M18 family aminopeptidase [Ruminococcaceae bacterium]|nr:M18 family aminopeptidase [Oscillospiraceae bacterium]
MEQSIQKQATALLSFIDRSPTAYHAVKNLQSMLAASGFMPFDAHQHLQPGDKYYVSSGSSALFAFTIGEDPLRQGFHVIGAHNDAPALMVKPNSLISSEGYLKMNTEIYGGPILNTWCDRPLALAGRVVCTGENPLQPHAHLVQPAGLHLVIPNVAIHMNRTVNDGQKVEPQKTMLPVLGLADRPTEGLLEQLIAAEAGIDPASVVDYELFLYDSMPGMLLGLDDALINTPRLDNLGMAYAAAVALTKSEPKAGINLLACFDHEEVGSQTRQGAHSLILRDLMERIILSLGGTRLDLLNSFAPSFMISADQAHAAHPNYGELTDATSRPRINGGPVIKRAANRSYTTDADTSAVFKALCRQANVPCQTFVNRSDMRGGSTIGPALSQFLPIRSVDTGNPIWAMHAIRETGGTADHAAMLAVFQEFFRHFPV